MASIPNPRYIACLNQAYLACLKWQTSGQQDTKQVLLAALQLLPVDESNWMHAIKNKQTGILIALCKMSQNTFREVVSRQKGQKTTSVKNPQREVCANISKGNDLTMSLLRTCYCLIIRGGALFMEGKSEWHLHVCCVLPASSRLLDSWRWEVAAEWQEEKFTSCWHDVCFSLNTGIFRSACHRL